MMSPHTRFAVLAITLTLVHLTSAHSVMMDPQGISATSCRMGGLKKNGVKSCPGPCQFAKLETGKTPWLNFYPPDKPSATYKRGQKVTIKYQRNNHRSGGIQRFTLVPLDKMKDKAVHSANAFHYSCWGARVKVATAAEKVRDKYGFSLIGSDGQEHDQPAGYYTVDITIPPVVPDGKYMMGWAWFGGPSGVVTKNEPLEPRPVSYFSDYWSCSFVVIKGGVPLASSYTPIFVNDMDQFSEDGCMAHADDLGQCVREPCRDRKTFYRKPAAFLGDGPTPITPANFGGSVPPPQDKPAAEPPKEDPTVKPPKEDPMVKPPKEDPMVKPPKASPPRTEDPKPEPPTEKYPEPPAGEYPPPSADPPRERGHFDRDLMSCLCIVGSASKCFPELAAYSKNCTAGAMYFRQTKACGESCCALCKETGDKFSACRHRFTRWVCKTLDRS